MKFPIIIDSGANFYMFKDREFFSSILPATGKVILGGGVTSLPIDCVGTVKCLIGSQVLTIDNVRYLPSLSESIYSLFLHIKNPNHGFQSSFDTGLFLIFPQLQTQAIIGKDDLYLDAHPLVSFSSNDSSSHDSTSTSVNCRDIKSLQEDVLQETDYLDHLLHSLHRYYTTIKTK
jgi:hypothetical protein